MKKRRPKEPDAIYLLQPSRLVLNVSGLKCRLDRNGNYVFSQKIVVEPAGNSPAERELSMRMQGKIISPKAPRKRGRK